MSTLRSSYESILRNPGLPVGCRDSDIDGDEEPLEPRREATADEMAKFAATKLIEIFMDEGGSLLDENGNNCGPAKIASFGNVIADAWKEFCDKRRIY